nr:MAG TPA: ribonuclease HI [Caudoviricetes sp.]
MKAILWALYNYGVSADSFTYPIVYTDSLYCVNTFNDWMYRWKNNNWRKADKSTPENLDLIKFYDIIYNKWNRKIDLRKIKGHAGIEGNELADDLATGRVTVKEVLGE